MAGKKRGRRRGRDAYLRLIARREREGLTWRQVARDGRVPLATLDWWRRRLREEKSEPNDRTFVELAPTSVGEDAERIEVVLRSGRRLLLPNGSLPEGLLDLVRLLERPC